MKETVHETLLVLGVDTSDPLAMQADFRALREWREAMANVKRKSIGVIVSTLVAGLLAAVWIGVKLQVKG